MSEAATIPHGIVTGAKLAAAAFICCVMVSTTHGGNTNTSEAVAAEMRDTPPPVESATNSPAAILSPQDADRYRTIFAAQKRGDWAGADAAIAALTDKLLLGSALADRYQRRAATLPELTAWLKSYGAQPEAEELHAKATRLAAKTGKVAKVPAAQTPAPWSGGYAADTAADFSVNLAASSGKPPPRLAQDIAKALRDDNPAAARNLLIAAQASETLAGTFAIDAEAAIGANFFYSGERDQARALTSTAAAANQPLGMWVRGLIAFEDGDMAEAGRHFSRLADHPALNEGTRAAAAFWAWRSLNRSGDSKGAKANLAKAAKESGSFYGLLAAQLLGRNPTKAAAQIDAVPQWNAARRDILAARPAGKRALALLQIGETARAEATLRRINPRDGNGLRQAMMALAGYVPMPALALQLASLNAEAGQDFAAALYPVPPWQPQHGFEIDRALLFALARHESQFDPDAVSARGARGLMQIMPDTAEGMAETQDAQAEDKLFDPAFNMALGQKYVRHLAARPQIGDNLLLLLAAYNCGPNKVARWKQARNTHDALLFMEGLPLRETRNYITRVLPHYWAYRARFAEPLTSLRQMAEGQWPRANLKDSGTKQASLTPAAGMLMASSN